MNKWRVGVNAIAVRVKLLLSRQHSAEIGGPRIGWGPTVAINAMTPLVQDAGSTKSHSLLTLARVVSSTKFAPRMSGFGPGDVTSGLSGNATPKRVPTRVQ